MTNSILTVKNVYKSFKVGKQSVPVLKNVSFEVKDGDFLVIYGPSGCGKSTLLHGILGLEAPTQGSINFLAHELYSSSQTEDTRTSFRKEHIGMVYQQPNWIKSLTVLENVAFPLSLLGIPSFKREGLALEFLKKVGMENWKAYVPSELSSGQQQKVALARALITNPRVIIADEPTGNLDFESGQDLMNTLKELNQKEKRTIIMVTHDLEYLKYANRTVKMLDGEITDKDVEEKNISYKRKHE